MPLTYRPRTIALQGADLYECAKRMAPHMVQTTLADYVRLDRFRYRAESGGSVEVIAHLIGAPVGGSIVASITLALASASPVNLPSDQGSQPCVPARANHSYIWGAAATAIHRIEDIPPLPNQGNPSRARRRSERAIGPP